VRGPAFGLYAPPDFRDLGVADFGAGDASQTLTGVDPRDRRDIAQAAHYFAPVLPAHSAGDVLDADTGDAARFRKAGGPQ